VALEENKEATKEIARRAIRRFWVLKYMAERRDQPPIYVHRITKDVQRMMDVTLRDQDIKACIEDLVRLQFVERMPVGDGVAYKIREQGIDWWIENREKLSLLILLSPR